MAQNQKSRGLSRFLDFIGLVDSDKDDMNMPPKNNARPAKKRQPVVDDDMDDLFDDGPSSRRPNVRTDNRQARPQNNNWDSPRFDPRQQTSGRYGRYQNGYGNYDGYAQDSYRNPPRQQPRNSGYAPMGEMRNPYRQQPGAPAYPQRENVYEQAENTSPAHHQMVIINLHTVDECKEVILALLSKKSVLVNMVNMTGEARQRALDTLGGATFAIHAHVDEGGDCTWLFTPSTVEVANQRGDDRGGYGYR